jgi:hypothetical protein
LNWVLTVVLCALLVEVALRLPFLPVLRALSRASGKAVQVIRTSAISDHWKEKAVAAYARITFLSTLQLAGFLVVLLGPAVVVVIAFDHVWSGFEDFILGWLGIGCSVVAATGYYWLRKVLFVGGNYGPLDRVLHYLALGSPAVAEMCFDMDQRQVVRDASSIEEGRHVFISGLARAGTTILMRRFFETGQFRSLTYRDMPFVLAPNLWRKLSGWSNRELASSERAHGDNILVDVDSPESLDEVFWRVFAGDEYIERTFLKPHEPSAEITRKFVAYVNAILSAQDTSATRYLSKNNNNTLRLDGIRRAFPKALILVPFRDPAAHAYSLMRQHKSFSAMQVEDRFVRSYMTWLVHHEFGLDHRPFRVNACRVEAKAATDTGRIEYWLELWCEVYEWLDRCARPDVVFVCYEDLCAGPDVWRRLSRIAGIEEATATNTEFRSNNRDELPDADQALLERATVTYARLRERSQAALASECTRSASGSEPFGKARRQAGVGY